ncbi:MAG: YihY/virulence factor BrkB family protein [Planctomycetaceae bacterium]
MHRRILSNYQHVIAAPESELTKMQKRLRYGVELISHCRGELIRVRAEGMAAELTYRTIFSLIPVLVLALVMFRVVGGLDEVQSKVEDQLYSFFGVPEVPEEYGADPVEVEPDLEPLSQKLDEFSPAAPVASSGDVPFSPLLTDNPSATAETNATTPTNNESKRVVRASIRRALQDATEKVANIDFASIGIIGLGLFIYTAVTLANAVEHLFNIVYEVPSGRPFHIRLAIHWSILTLGGGLLVMSLYLSSQFLDYMGGVVGVTHVSRLLNHGLSMFASWVLLFLLYALMPNTQVSVRAAAVGSLACALLWEVAKFAFQVYVAKAVPYSALYGSLGLIPLFLFWIYVTWMLVLFGLVLTKTLQTLHGRHPNRLRIATDHLPNGDPDWMVPIMTEVAKEFANGRAIELQEIVERLQLPGTIVHPMLTKLEHAGLLRRVVEPACRDDQVTLAKPAGSIHVADILNIAHRRPEGMGDARWILLDQLNIAQIQAAGNKTLADLS